MVFPLGGSLELAIPLGLRGAIYCLALVYWFLGISVIADVFMASIERVTSWRARRPLGKGRSGYRTAKVWNATVATLTLMALGSSAPEIFLAIIDIWKKHFHFGALGPSTIVGSASFNLLVIIAVCIAVIPAGEVRVIQNLPAFYITAAFSIAAYVWMAFIVLVSSVEIVELWEALVTFMLLPLLIYLSYKVDKGAANGLFRRLHIIDEEDEGGDRAEGGHIVFTSQSMRVSGSTESQTLEVAVVRTAGADGLGPVSCRYHTEAMAAVPAFDFAATEGTLEWAEGEETQYIKLQIPGRSSRGREADFLLILGDAEGGAAFNPEADGGSEEAILTVILEAHGPERSLLMRNLDAVVSFDGLRLGAIEWADQVKCLAYCNGSAEEQREASKSDWALHVLAWPWKLFAALSCPPVCLGGGWVCFFASLVVVAFLTACVSDLAELFGCVLSVPDIITAITFVAMGTSMPDLFASITAAKDDATADASIVNVTGSNSVNVFLGLGVPWTMAAIHWLVTGRTAEWEALYPNVAARISGAAFVVEANDLGFSLIAFLWVCFLGLLMLQLRRRWLKAELGGPFCSKVATSGALLTYWAAWVYATSGQVLAWGAAVSIVPAFVATIVATVLPICIMRRDRDSAERRHQPQLANLKPYPGKLTEKSGAMDKAVSVIGSPKLEDGSYGRSPFDSVGVGQVPPQHQQRPPSAKPKAAGCATMYCNLLCRVFRFDVA